MQFVNKREMAKIIGVTLKGFDEMMQRGCPVAQVGGHGKQYQFETSAVINWLRKEDKKKSAGGDIEEIKRRKAEADAQLAELKAGAAAGIYVEIDDLIKEVANDYIHIKSRVLQMPKRMPPVLVSESAETIAKILTDEIENIFSEIKNRFILERGGLPPTPSGGD